MFYEIKVFNGKGKLEKKITSQELSDRHWSIFQGDLVPTFNKDKIKLPAGFTYENDYKFQEFRFDSF